MLGSRVSVVAGWLALASFVSAAEILSTGAYYVCDSGVQDVTVSAFQLDFDRATKLLVFEVAGVSKKTQNVTGILSLLCDL
jgi:hypothetical protein